VIPDYRTKLCTGPSHPEPTWLPLDPEHWHFHRSGRKQGLALARCRDCANWDKLQKKGGPHGYAVVNRPLLHQLLNELIQRCGSIREVYRRYGISESTIDKLLRSDHERVQKRTIQKILAALYEQRKRDRVSGTSSKRFLRARRAHAQAEGQLEAQYGL
jgi:hypothetical protein